MPDTNLSVVLHGVKDLRLEETPVLEPAPNEVQISIRSVGICGSDVALWQNGAIGNLVVKKPLVMGHEATGVITQIGDKVTHLKIGDRVAIEPNQPCGSCRECKVGRYNLCGQLRYMASPPSNGALTRLYCHLASFVHKLPDHVSLDEGALVQPLALGFYACERANVSVGKYVLISGAGPLGMSVLIAAKLRGAAKICVTDVLQDRLDFIKRSGADVTVLVGKETPQETSAKVVQALGREVDISIECSGHYTATCNAIYSTRVAGTIVQIGFGQQKVEIPLVLATLKELDIRGMIRFANTYETVIEAIATGQVQIKQLVTHRFPLEKALDAFDASFRREGVKIIIDCDRNAKFE